MACLTEQPGNKLRLRTMCHGVTVEEIGSWCHERAVSRVCTSNHKATIFSAFDYEEWLLLGSGALNYMLTPPSPPAFVYLFPRRYNKHISHYLLQTACCRA